MRILKLLILTSIITWTSCQSTKTTIPKDLAKTALYLVRHAEKADDGTKDPPLTKAGIERAQALYQLLKSKNITRVYATDYKRTRETAAPTAEGENIAITSYDPRRLQDLATELSGLKGEHVLVSGHSNSTPTLANLILGTETYKQYEESEYGNLIIITISQDGHLQSTKEQYGPRH